MGKTVSPDDKVSFVRTIPTRVGKTKHCVGAVRINADHPPTRVGKTTPGRSGRGENCGPSPRGWGKPPRGPGAAATHRTIPTRVGKTRSGLTTKDISTDHPHAGGENALVGREVVARRGPSPRGGGKRARRAAWRCPSRTIPTRVGKTFRRTKAWPLLTGPSPTRVGKRSRPSPRLGGPRTIPTRVGKTGRANTSAPFNSDHPHAGGENNREEQVTVVTSRTIPHAGGENPHVYGGRIRRGLRTIPTRVGKTPCAPILAAAADGPSPTRVGKTSSFHRSHSHPPDHPHAGGENQER